MKIVAVKKRNLIIALSLLSLYLVYALYRMFAKVDDWQSPTYTDSIIIYVFLAFCLLKNAGWLSSAFRGLKQAYLAQTVDMESRIGLSVIVKDLAFGFVLMKLNNDLIPSLKRDDFQVFSVVMGTLYFIASACIWRVAVLNGVKILRRLGTVLFVAVFCGVLAAIAIPNFNSARGGFSVGGAKDIDNFRRNIENGYLPLRSDLTYEGLFYDYYFQTNPDAGDAQNLFNPTYSTAVTVNPLNEKKEYYLSVGLNSNLDMNTFKRKKLNLVVILDISGSMRSPFYRYYYDQYSRERSDENDNKSKMQVAKESIKAMMGHLKDGDRFGMVLFDHSAYVVKPLRSVETTDMDAIRGHIDDLRPCGGTSMELGLKTGISLYGNLLNSDPEEYENRIIFLTDAMPNQGMVSKDSLLEIAKQNSSRRLYTTFIGIGVDFNSELVRGISQVTGANYYSVHSSSDFKRRMDEEFEYMVTPMVFDLKIRLLAEKCEIEKIFGSPEADLSTSTLLKVNTLFPSKLTEEGIRGGIILLRLSEVTDMAKLKLQVSYRTRKGESETSEVSVTFSHTAPDHFDNEGIRKGILLSRYAEVLDRWLEKEWNSSTAKNSEFNGYRTYHWERSSVGLHVSKDFKDRFTGLKSAFEKETVVLSDASLDREIRVLESLIDAKK